MNVNDLQALIDGLDLGGMTGRDAMRNVGQATIMALLEHRGAAKLLAARLGFANSGVLSVATADLGWRTAGTRDHDGMGTTKRTSVKIKGSLPSKTSAAIAMVLGMNPAEDDIGWEEYKRAVDAQGVDWIDHLYFRLGGRDSEGGKDFTAWIDSNRAADAFRAEAERLAAEKAAKESDPLYQAKQRIQRLDKLLDAKELEIATLKARIAALEAPRSGNGLPLDIEMLRLIRQRFHPDRNNGNADLCEKVMKWINGIALDCGL